MRVESTHGESTWPLASAIIVATKKAQAFVAAERVCSNITTHWTEARDSVPFIREDWMLGSLNARSVNSGVRFLRCGKSEIGSKKVEADMSKDINLNRREFIKSVSMCAAALPALSFGVFSLSGCSTQPDVIAQTTRLPYSAGPGSMPCSSCIAPSNMSWQTTIASKDEKGESLIMSGTIYQPNGTTPAEGIVLYVYHTDSTGYYNKEDDPYNPRLRGWMKTGKDGRYEFKTIKPAPYPKRTTPAHIHAQIYNSQIPEYSIDEYWFEGDPFITPEEKAKLTGRGGFNSIIKLTRGDDGILRRVRNIKLDSVQK